MAARLHAASLAASVFSSHFVSPESKPAAPPPAAAGRRRGSVCSVGSNSTNGGLNRHRRGSLGSSITGEKQPVGRRPLSSAGNRQPPLAAPAPAPDAARRLNRSVAPAWPDRMASRRPSARLPAPMEPEPVAAPPAALADWAPADLPADLPAELALVRRRLRAEKALRTREQTVRRHSCAARRPAIRRRR